MRLEKTFVDFLIEKVIQFDPHAEIFLYGSRVNNELRGGDIDLFILSETLNFSQKLDLLVDLKIKFGEQKIDLLIKSRDQASLDPFVQSILPSAIRLNP
jgi:predicted nucleotidyltransferase